MTNDDFIKLIENRAETNKIDFKEKFNWKNSSKSEKGQIVKDILSFSNISGGGRIVFGIRDADYEPIGLEKEDFESFDTTDVNSYLKQYTDPPHNCSVQKIIEKEKYFIVIEVNEFKSEPILCKKDLQDENGKSILQNGALYYRTESAESTQIKTSIDMRDVLTRALKNRADDILRAIRTLLSNKEILEPTIDKLNTTKQYADKLIDEKIGDLLRGSGFGTIKIVIMPGIELTELIPDSFALRERMKKAQVTYRGWDFPHEQDNKQHGDTFTIDNGIMSFTNWSRHIEALCMFQNGLFVWESAFWEDSEMENKGQTKYLSFLSFIYSCLEYILFINKYYDFNTIKPDIVLNIEMNGCKGRKISSNTIEIMLRDNYECKIDQIKGVEIRFNVAESISDPKSFAKMLTNKVFQYFGFRLENVVMDKWQNIFLSREF